MSCKDTKVEFAVQIKDASCVNAVKLKLKEFGVKSDQIEATIDSTSKECRIVLRSEKPWIELQETIESTGRRSVLVGLSDMSAVVMLEKGKDSHVKGVIRFCSIESDKAGIVIDGVIDGLKPEVDHTICIREFGDISQGSSNLGDVYKNSCYNVKPDEKGRSTIRLIEKKLNVLELVGRSVTVSNDSQSTIGFGVISRAAGVFQNWKRICACDGKTLWDERDKPRGTLN